MENGWDLDTNEAGSKHIDIVQEHVFLESYIPPI